jgi:plastocyanin
MALCNALKRSFQQTPAAGLVVLTGVLLAIAVVTTACADSSVARDGVPANSSAAAPATGGSKPQSAEPDSTYSVTMNDSNRFQPTTLTVPRGATVMWNNVGQTTHTVTADPAKAINKADVALPTGAEAWDSGSVAGGQSFSHTLDVPACTGISVCRTSPLAWLPASSSMTECPASQNKPLATGTHPR